MTKASIICTSLVTVGLSLALTSCFNREANPPVQPKKPAPERPEIDSRISGIIKNAKDIYDGDSLTLRSAGNGQIYKIRMWGVDAFEMGQRCKINGQISLCGAMGRDRLREYVKALPNQEISCLVKGHDRYKRVLAQCSGGGVDLGRLLVREGLAIAYQNNPAYKASENEANTLKRGVWAGTFITPQDWRKHCKPKPRGKAARPLECLM